MASKLEAIFKLIDQASGPASRISKALDNIADAGGRVKGGIAERFEALANAAKGAWGPLKGVAEAVGIAAAAVGTFAIASAGAVYELGKFALEASEAKKRGVASLELIDGAGVDAENTLKRLRDAANLAGRSDKDLLRMYTSLRQIGFSSATAEDQVSAMLDVAAIKGDEGAAALEKMFEKIRAGGKFEVSTKQLVGAGISQDALNQSLRSIDRFRGASDAQLKAAMDAGLITADEGTRAILHTIDTTFDKGKGLGSAAKLISGNSFDGRIAAIKNELGALFENLDTKPLIDALRTFQAVLSSPAGQKAVASIMAMFASLGDKLAAIATPENITKLVEGLGELASILIELGKAAVGGLGEGFMAIMQPAIDVFRDIGGGAGGMRGMVDVMKILGQTVGAIAAIFVYGFAAIGLAIYGIVKTVQAVVAFISQHWEGVKTILLVSAAIVAAPFFLIQAAIVGVVYGVVRAVTFCAGLVVSAWKAVGSAFMTAVEWIGGAIATGIGYIVSFGAAWWSVVKAVGTVLLFVPRLIYFLLIDPAKAAAAKVGEAAVAVGAWFVSIYDSIAGALGQAWAFVTSTFDGIAVAIGGALVSIWDSIVGFLVPILAAVSDFATSVWSWLTGAFDSAVDYLAGIADTLYNTALDIIDGLWEGIKAGWKSLIEKFKALVDLLPTAVKKALGIASPSRVFMEIGAYTMRGMTIGIEDAANDTRETMQSAAESVTGVGRDASAQGGARRGVGRGGDVHIHVSVNASPGMSPADAEAIGRGVGRGLRDEMGDVLEQVAIEMGAIEAA